jgi:2'-5' RNA ligase
MIRLFVALPVPNEVAQSLMLIQAGVPGARWQVREQLHLTLAFIGEVDGSLAAAIDDVLAGILVPDFSLQLHGVGQFGEGKRSRSHALWAGVRPNPALEHLQRKVGNAIRRVGTAQEAHKYTPHVTVARMRHPEPGKVVEWLTQHALYTSPEFDAGAFHLYSSKLTSDGSIYRVEQTYPLQGFGNWEDEDGKVDN